MTLRIGSGIAQMKPEYAEKIISERCQLNAATE